MLKQVMSQSSEDSLKDEVFESLRGFIRFRDRTEHEVRNYLQKKGFSEADIQGAVEELRKRNVIDDRRFVERYISDAIRLMKKGPVRIRRELNRLGIRDEELKELLSCEESVNEADQILSEEVERLSRNLEFTPKNRKRLIEKLLRRGFEFEKIITELDRNRTD